MYHGFCELCDHFYCLEYQIGCKTVVKDSLTRGSIGKLNAESSKISGELIPMNAWGYCSGSKEQRVSV